MTRHELLDALGEDGLARLQKRVEEVLPAREFDVVLVDQSGWLIAAEVLKEIHRTDPMRL